MRKMTEQNQQNAFAGESQAHMRYLIFADVAEKEGKPNVARLFRAIAYAERVHAGNHLETLGGIGDSAANLEVAIGGETFEVSEMYPAYDVVARLQGEAGAAKAIHYALEAEKIHAEMFTKAKASVEKGQDVELGKVSVCPECGYTVEGQVPEYCPVCGAKREVFRSF